MDFYKGVFLGPVLVGKGDNSFFLKMRLSRFCKWAPQIQYLNSNKQSRHVSFSRRKLLL